LAVNFEDYPLIDLSLQKYPTSPVTQAVIEVRVDYEMDIKGMHKIVGKLKKDYPHQQTVKDIGIDITHEVNTSITPLNERFQLSSRDELDYAIISKNSIAVTRYAPYLGWDALHEHLIKVWKLWKDVAKTQKISRIGARNINRIDIPCNKGEIVMMEDYFTFYPEVPGASDSPIIEYLMQVTRQINNTSWYATITSTYVPSPLINYVSFILDIDVFCSNDIPINDDKLFSMIAETRNIKNTVFQGYVTQKTKDLYS